MLFKKILNQESVSAIGLGCGINILKEGAQDYKKLSYLVDYALDHNCNLIDTAPVYGNGDSETIIGKIIKKKRSKVFLATKVSLTGINSSEIEKSCNDSLNRLKTDYIDLLQIHWPNPQVNLIETINKMEKLLESGKIRYIGVSNFSIDEIENSISGFKKSSLASIQSEYNLFERSIEEKIQNFAIKKEILILAYSPLWQGKLVNGKEQLKTLDKISNKYGITKTQLVLNYLAGKKNIIPIPNTSDLKKLKENLNSLNFTINKDDISQIDKNCRTPISLVDPKSINIVDPNNKKIYSTLEEAIENKLILSPSRIELSKDMLKGNFLKPIRIKLNKDHINQYSLIEGRLRYWSWIIAYGFDKKIPALVCIE